MATLLGRNSTIEVSTDDATYNAVGKVLSGSLALSNDIADETNNDSAGAKEGKYADSQLNVDVTFKYDEASTGQDKLLAAANDKTTLYYRFRPVVNSGVANEWKAKCLISSLTFDSSTGEVIEGSATLESTGAITFQVQP